MVKLTLSIKRLMFRAFNKNIHTWNQKKSIRNTYSDIKMVLGQNLYHRTRLL